MENILIKSINLKAVSAFFILLCMGCSVRNSSLSETCRISEEPAQEDLYTPQCHKDPKSNSSILKPLFLYAPNRVLDLLDIARARIRVGPGFSAGIRATRIVQANIGSYATLYAGLPGPRNEDSFKLPVGLELYTGGAISMASVETETLGPDYSPSEIGLGMQLAILGFDIGIDPVEIIDFITGFVFVDISNDDINLD